MIQKVSSFFFWNSVIGKIVLLNDTDMQTDSNKAEEPGVHLDHSNSSIMGTDLSTTKVYSN